MTNYVARVRGAARTVAVPNGARREVTRPSRPGDDHSARIRIAQTLGLEVPRSLRSSRTRQPSTADPSVPGPCARLLAAAGPLRMTTLVSAIERSRRFRDRAPLALIISPSNWPNLESRRSVLMTSGSQCRASLLLSGTARSLN